MGSVAILLVAAMLAWQGNIEGPRKAFTACLKQAGKAAEAAKTKPEEYAAFAKERCSGEAASLKSVLVGFDVKNGIARSKAAASAQTELDDYLTQAAEGYAYRSGGAD